MTKRRHIPISEYFIELQKEWFVNSMKSKIFPKRKDRDFYTKVMDGKKEKINNIAAKNQLPSIFDDEDVYDTYRKEIFVDHGKPPCLTTEEEICNYYYQSSDVKVLLENDQITTGIISAFSYTNLMVTVKLRGEKDVSIHPVSRVTRIF